MYCDDARYLYYDGAMMKQYTCQAGYNDVNVFCIKEPSFNTDSFREAVEWCKTGMVNFSDVNIRAIRIIDNDANDVVAEYSRMWVLTSTG